MDNLLKFFRIGVFFLMLEIFINLFTGLKKYFFPLLDMTSNMCTVYVRHPLFLSDILLWHLLFCTHLLLRFFIGFGYTLRIENVTLCRSRSRILAISMIELFLTIVKGCVILNYYHKELHLRCCRGCISPSAYTRTGILNAV